MKIGIQIMSVMTIPARNAAAKTNVWQTPSPVYRVKILRNNYAAEYGNNGGAIINIISKGGGDYRGSAYYFLRNEALNANSFFNNKGALPKPLYRQNTGALTLAARCQSQTLAKAAHPWRGRKQTSSFHMRSLTRSNLPILFS